MKNNQDLVAYAKAQIGKPYWFGTFGQLATEKLLAEKAGQYPKQYSTKRLEKAKKQHLGNKVHDCYGLFKGFLMSKSPIDVAVYNKKFDISADTAFNRATEKGTIDTLPVDLVGVGLWKKNHFGIYIGNGKEIEARGFDYGVVEDEVANTKFTHWFKMPEIEYITDSAEPSNPSENAPSEPPKDSAVKTYTVIKGDTLSKIAVKFGVSVSQLVEWNGIQNPDLINIGQVLKILSADSPAPEYFLGKVTTERLPLNVRRGSGLNYPIIGSIPRSSTIKIAYETAGWYKLYGREGFVFAGLVTKL